MKRILFLTMLLIACTFTKESYGQGILPFGQATSRSQCKGELQIDSGLRFQPRILGKFKGTNDSTFIVAINSADSMPYYSKDSHIWYPLVDTGLANAVKYSDTLPGHPIFTQAKYNTQSAKNILDSGNAFNGLMIIGTTDSNGVMIKTENLERFHIYKDGGVSLGIAKEAAANIFSINKQIQIGDTVNRNMGIGMVNNGPVPFSKITTGAQNQLFGWDALDNVTSGNNNLAMMPNSLNALTIGQYNISIGTNAGQLLRAGSNNTFIGGVDAGHLDTSGSNNNFIGNRAGVSMKTGSNNTLNGASAGDSKTQLSNCTLVGYNAGGNPGSANILRNVTGVVAIGYNAGVGDSSDQKLYIDYNSSNTIDLNPLIWGDFANSIVRFRGNDTVVGNLVVKGQTYLNTLPAYAGTGNGDSLLIATGSGNNLQKIAAPITASATLDFPSTASLAQNTLTITVTGAAAGDVVCLGTPVASATTGTFWAYCSATNTVTVVFNNTSSGAVDPASGTFKVRVFKQ